MKTTIDISDGLLERCKEVGREQGVTFRALVEEGLNKVLEERMRRAPFRLRQVPARGGGFQAGFEGGEWSSIRDATYEGRGG